MNIMDLKTNMGNPDQTFHFKLDKIYSYLDGTAYFKGKVIHYRWIPDDSETLSYESNPVHLDRALLEEELIEAKDVFNNWAEARNIPKAR